MHNYLLCIIQGYTNDNPSFVPFNEIYESLSIDKDRIIVKLSKGLEPHIEKRELIKVILFVYLIYLKYFF